MVVNKGNATINQQPALVSGVTADGQEHNIVVPGIVDGGTILYSVNGGEYSEKIPSIIEAGTYSVSFKVEGDSNHFGLEEQSLGSIVVEVAPVTPVDPVNPSGKGLSAGAVIGIVLGSIVAFGGLCYLFLFFLLNKWIKVGDKAVRVMRFALGKKDGKERYLSFKCKFEYRDKNEVYNTKDEALK